MSEWDATKSWSARYLNTKPTVAQHHRVHVDVQELVQHAFPHGQLAVVAEHVVCENAG